MASKTISKTSGGAAKKRTSKVPASIPTAKVDGALMAAPTPIRRLPTHDEIAFRAFELYQTRGGDGGALNDWLAAETELRAS
ncbi:MAG TPA: DUF2934 domain-containing protein [Polyangiales bacterium]|nr:DUF2934 domain-containing protein [Polyangiales bacterium]